MVEGQRKDIGDFCDGTLSGKCEIFGSMDKEDEIFFYIISLLCFDLDCAVFIISRLKKNFQKTKNLRIFFN